MNHYERVCASVNLDAVKNNIKEIHAKQGDGLKIMAVVKSDGYGHGALPLQDVWKRKTIFMDLLRRLRKKPSY